MNLLSMFNSILCRTPYWGFSLISVCGMKFSQFYRKFIIVIILCLLFIVYSSIQSGLLKTEFTGNLIKSRTEISEQKGRWSEKWPKVNLNNCSHREYMNKGINSPKVIDNLNFPRAGIVSAPGSGNTWVRHLIEQATGLYTGSIYSDKRLYAGGFKGELEDCKNNSTIAVKGHSIYKTRKYNCTNDRVILIIRDIYRIVLAEFNRLNSSKNQSERSHVGVAEKHVFRSDNWYNFATRNSRSFSISIVDWINKFIDKTNKLRPEQNPFTLPPDYWSRLLLVSYEKLLHSPISEVKRIVKFLGVPVFRKHCLKENLDGKFRRPPQSSQSVACLYDQIKLRPEIARIWRTFFNKTTAIGAGNISEYFEGIDNIKLGSDCTF